jgi:hypothetical protein
LAASFLLFSADASTILPPNTIPLEREQRKVEPFLSGAYFVDRYEEEVRAERAEPYGVKTEIETLLQKRRENDFSSVLLNDDVLAFYGSPLSKRMGILGVHPIIELDRILNEWAVKYNQVNGDRGVRKAFYIIYGMAWPEGEIGLLGESRLIEYIEYAAANDILVFVDHQIGKYPVAEAVKRLLPFLRYPNVHLALDPEWRTIRPMVEIGSVTAEEINDAQHVMQDYLEEYGYPGERMLVIHQFHYKMIGGRERVQATYPRVRLIHCADGFGPPAVKRIAYNFNAQAPNIPVKGFKLFFNSGIPGTSYDEPLMRPEEVVALEPKPYLVMYQ